MWPLLGSKGLFRGWLSFPGDWFPTRLHIKRSKEAGKEDIYGQEYNRARTPELLREEGFVFQWNLTRLHIPELPRKTHVTTAASTC